jgi:hypothetical protein
MGQLYALQQPWQLLLSWLLFCTMCLSVPILSLFPLADSAGGGGEADAELDEVAGIGDVGGGVTFGINLLKGGVGSGVDLYLYYIDVFG